MSETSKACAKCSILKPLYEFSTDNATLDKHHSYCKLCHQAYNKKWKEENNYKYDKKTYYRNARQAAITQYGGQCICCAEKEPKFLAFDHINNNGNEERRKRMPAYKNIAIWLKRNNYPNSFQLLCHNCNLAKGFYGGCPHAE